MAFTRQCNTTVAQQQQQPKYTSDDTLHWSKDRQLTWDDFQGVEDTFFVGVAATSSDFFSRIYYTSDTTFGFVISTIFFKKYSWVKEEGRTFYALNHEQGHFNIAEIYARKLRRALKNYRLNKATVIEDVKNISDSIKKEKNRIQELYDRETKYSTNKGKQKEWDKKIAAWLAKQE